MKYQKWNLRGGDPGGAAALERGGLDPLCAAVLSARGIAAPSEAERFLADGPDRLHDPLLLRDMDAAAGRVRRALEAGETIAVYGDYDVDGITSTALLTSYLRSQGGRVIPYIPDRIEEGYGLNGPAVERLAEEGVTLIVTVDCGITAVEETARARALGVDVVITDHHQCKDTLPDAAAVVDPRRADCPYPFKELAGVGVALKLVLALAGPEGRDRVLDDYLDLAAVGTVADVMKLTDENRFLVRRGLELLSHTRRPGLAALLREAGAEGKPITAVTIGYGLAPRINAAGRMEQAEVALELLLTPSPERGMELAARLCELNRERQAIELAIYEQCVSLLDRQPQLAGPSIVLAGEGWHQGVVGIVASRLAEKYACPAFMICLDQGRGKGSCRSFGGFNLFAGLEQCSDLLEGFGGHELAAGFTIRADNVAAFKQRMDALVSVYSGGAPMETVLEVDALLDDAALLSTRSVEALERLEPFGAGNPKPVFALRGAVVASCADVGGGRHLKLRLRCGHRLLDGIFFSATAAAAGIAPGDRIDVAFTPQINTFRDVRSVQLQLCDLRPALTRAQAEHALYEKFCSGAPLTQREAAALLPEREDFVAVWKFLKRSAAAAPLEDSDVRLYKLISRSLPPQRPHIRTAVCLEVLDERGLISLRRSAGRVYISLNQTTGKVDLEQSSLMLRLRAVLDDKESR